MRATGSRIVTTIRSLGFAMWKSEIVFEELPSDDPKVRQPDITRAREILGWEPKVRRRDGLRKTLEYFQRKI